MFHNLKLETLYEGHSISMVKHSTAVRSLKPLLMGGSLSFLAHHKVLMVSYCDRSLSVVRRRLSCVVRKLFYLNIFSSETTLDFDQTSQE